MMTVTNNTILQQIREAGVIGAGGAGFPTYKKLEARVEHVLANGAECEPLLHKDRETMLHDRLLCNCRSALLSAFKPSGQ